MNSNKTPTWLFDLDFSTKTQPNKSIKLRVGSPYQFSQDTWAVDSLLNGSPNKKIHQSKGSDPFQAMSMLMLRVRYSLEANGDEYYCDDVPIRALFRRAAPISYGVEFQDEIEAMI